MTAGVAVLAIGIGLVIVRDYPNGGVASVSPSAHTQLGARIGPAIPRSLHITGAVSEWESWTHMRFPETGDYVFPAGLATVHIDTGTDSGEYWEPNVWIIHDLSTGTPGRGVAD